MALLHLSRHHMHTVKVSYFHHSVKQLPNYNNACHVQTTDLKSSPIQNSNCHDNAPCTNNNAMRDQIRQAIETGNSIQTPPIEHRWCHRILHQHYPPRTLPARGTPKEKEETNPNRSREGRNECHGRRQHETKTHIIPWFRKTYRTIQVGTSMTTHKTTSEYDQRSLTLRDQINIHHETTFRAHFRSTSHALRSGCCSSGREFEDPSTKKHFKPLRHQGPRGTMRSHFRILWSFSASWKDEDLKIRQK